MSRTRADLIASTQAVLFDFDGVIADTESVHFETFEAILSEEGVALPPGESSSDYMGIHDRAAFGIAFDKVGRCLDRQLCEDLVDRKSRIYGERVAQISLFPGVPALVESAVRRGPTTIASGGRRRDIEAVLQKHGLLSHFPSFISGDDVERSKPDPQCFLEALRLLRSDPAPDLRAQSCLVFEDSARGVEAARRAGMMCVAVTNSYPREKLGEAHLVIDSLEEWTWDVR